MKTYNVTVPEIAIVAATRGLFGKISPWRMKEEASAVTSDD